AYAYTLRDADEFLLQRELVAEGLARVSTRIARPCSEHLLDREKAAREAKLGLWAEYEVLNAEAPNDALAYRGRFALIEGKVASVRESGALGTLRLRSGNETSAVSRRRVLICRVWPADASGFAAGSRRVVAIAPGSKRSARSRLKWPIDQSGGAGKRRNR